MPRLHAYLAGDGELELVGGLDIRALPRVDVPAGI
ncbi:hypothetical protein ABID58_007092 [Bradyrhizobium sp. S3.2.6]